MKTIWSNNALPLVPPRFRPIYTVLLPIADLMLLAFGATAVVVGSHVVADFTLRWFPFAWAGVMGFGAVLASIGLVFCRDWLELAGKFALVIGFGVYALVLVFYILDGSTSSMLTVELVVIAITGLLVRIGDLIGEIGRKEADESARRRLARTKGKHL